MTQELRSVALVGCCLLLACPKVAPDARDVVALPGEGLEGSPDAGRSAAQVRLDQLDAEVGAALAEDDEALWRHWTQGAPLELARGHDALFSKATVDFLRTEKSPRARHLEAFIISELLSRGLLSDTQAVASLEASANFTVDGREVAWRELPRLLVTEKSAVKRRALWAASGQVVERLDALLAHRDAKTRELLASLDVPSSLELWASVREVNAEALAADARALLEKTDEAWRETLATLSAAELKLPVAALTRADLPRLLKVPPAVDAAFPRAQVVPFALATLGALGVQGQPGYTFELGDSAKKRPLPLTVAPKPSDVRVSFRPAGGLRDMTQLLAELGTAVALHGAATGFASTDRLGDPSHALVVAELFGSLVTEKNWLAERGVAEPLQPQVLASARAQRLYALRRACLLVLLRIETEGLPEADARLKASQLVAQALGLKPAPEDAQRWRVELEDGLRSASVLKAALLAALERERLGSSWWTTDGLQKLAPRLAAGTSENVWPAGGAGEAVAALVRQLVPPPPPMQSPPEPGRAVPAVQ